MWNSVTVTVANTLNQLTSYINPAPNLGEDRKKRKVLLVHCHPVPESFSTAIASAVHTGLTQGGHEVRLRRLYSHGKSEECFGGKTFPPLMDAEERRGYHVEANVEMRSDHQLTQAELNLKNKKSAGEWGMGQAKGQGGKVGNGEHLVLAVEVREAIADLRWCDSLVLVYPTWWFNFPAAMKGFFDRVMLPGVAFKIPPKGNKAGAGTTGLLPGFTNISKIGVVTTYGAYEAAALYAGDNSRRFLSRAFRPLCAPNCHLLWHGLYSMDAQSLAQRETFLEKVREEYKTF